MHPPAAPGWNIHPLPTLGAPGIRLRALTHADAPALLALFGDPEVARYWSSPAMREIQEAVRLIDEIEALSRQGTLFQWGIVRNPEEPVLGTCTLHRLDRQHRRAEVGYALRREQWGRGLMSAALEVLLEHAFETLGLNRLGADTDPRNERSIRLLERFGFRREGHVRENFIVAGEIQDSLLLGLLRREWLERRPRSPSV